MGRNKNLLTGLLRGMKLEALPQVLVCGRFSENLELAYYDGSGPSPLGHSWWAVLG